VKNVPSPTAFFSFTKSPKSRIKGICPGTHNCKLAVFFDDELNARMEDEFENNSTLIEIWEDDYDEYFSHNVPLDCDLVVSASAGDGFLYNTELYHRGGGHSDPNAPERVVVFITLAESLVDANDTRTLAMGQSHFVRWDLWGHTIDEFTTMDKNKWRFWHSVGLFLPKQSKDVYRPWNLLDSLLLIFRKYGDEEEEGSQIGNVDIHFSDFHRMVEKLLLATFSTGMVYLLTITLFSCFTVRRESCKTCL
jgi:hypothetical protein